MTGSGTQFNMNVNLEDGQALRGREHRCVKAATRTQFKRQNGQTNTQQYRGKGEFMSTTTAENSLTERQQTQINLVSRQEVKCTLV
jgi:hypothetical protein